MAPTAELAQRFVHANGLRFHVSTCEPDGARADAPLALLLHGFPECAFSWRHQLPLLARLGWRAWAPDLRGYGETDRPPRVQDYAIEALLGDVAGLIDASGARDVLLVGHDWGGIIAWYFAMRRPRPLARLCVMNLPHPACMERALRRGPQLLRSWYALFFQLPWLPERLLAAGDYRAIRGAFRDMAVDESRFPDAVLDVYRDQAARPGALTAMLHYYRALLRGGSRRQRALGYPMIEIPTLLLWGEEDQALGIETTYGTERHVANLTLRYLPGVSHWVQQEAPEAVNAMLEAWLEGKPVPQAWEVAQ
ncbi:MAG TPA: alpha/beta hydrolase [Myxococcota bacterium]|jgi:pimeloyl-ACP methyl ester carboxylesterase|nr:alpha/beta hydrolase [Myxococcota bacterium]